MDKPIIAGIQQIGIGNPDVHACFKWYRQQFGTDIPVFDEAAEAGLMLPYTGGEPRQRHAILAINIQGGGGLEMSQNDPLGIKSCQKPAAGDIRLSRPSIDIPPTTPTAGDKRRLSFDSPPEISPLKKCPFPPS